MKKGILTKRKNVIRLCVSLLVGLILISVNHNISRYCQCTQVEPIVFSDSGLPICIQATKAMETPERSEWNIEVWVPSEMSSGYKVSNNISQSTVRFPLSAADILTRQPEPMPVGLYIVFLLAFGLVGFFSVGPVAVKPRIQSRVYRES